MYRTVSALFAHNAEKFQLRVYSLPEVDFIGVFWGEFSILSSPANYNSSYIYFDLTLVPRKHLRHISECRHSFVGNEVCTIVQLWNLCELGRNYVWHCSTVGNGPFPNSTVSGLKPIGSSFINHFLELQREWKMKNNIFVAVPEWSGKCRYYTLAS